MTNNADQTSNENPSSLLKSMHERLGIKDDEALSYLSKGRGGSFRLGYTKTAREIRESKWALDGADHWCSINPMSLAKTGRGKTEDVTRLAGLYADLDVKSPGFASVRDALSFVDHLSDILGTSPALVIHSGNGIQPIWALEDGERLSNEQSQGLLKWFGNFVQMEAEQLYGFKPDSVFDLTRVLRVPGTINWKDLGKPKPTSLDLPANWRPLSVTEVRDAFKERNAPRSVPVNPGTAVVEFDQWATNSNGTCKYVQAMIDAWPTDKPSAGRHQWAASQAMRVTAALRLGCIPRRDFLLAIDAIRARLVDMRSNGLFGPKALIPLEEVEDLARWAVMEIKVKPLIEVRAELGDHSHGEKEDKNSQKDIEEFLEGIARGASGPNDPLRASDAKFWESRPFLKWINQLARENTTPPVTVLATFLARYAAELPPQARTSTGACLNLFVGLYGRSGSGKSTAMRAVKQCGVEWEAGGGVPGSGEGVGRYFGSYDAKAHEWKATKTNAYFEMDEISTLLGAKARQGSTLEGILNSAFVGAPLEITYGASDKSFKVDDYSMSMVAGVQPGIADAVAERTETGFAQRFLWVKSTDMSMNNVTIREEYRVASRAKAAQRPPSASMRPRIDLVPRRFVVAVPEDIASLIEDQRFDKTCADDSEDVSTTEGNHDTLIRLKVAALFALIENREEISDEDWLYAGRLMSNSLEVRDSIKRAAITERNKESTAVGRRQARINEAVSESAMETLTSKVLRFASDNRTIGVPSSYCTFRKGVAKTKEARAMFNAAMAPLLSDGTFSKEKIDGKVMITYLGEPSEV